MAYDKPKTTRKSLDSVLKSYKKISECGGDTSQTQYKAINESTGEVFLVTSPASWKRRQGPDGRDYLARPEPTSMGSIKDLPIEKSGEVFQSEPQSWGVDNDF